MQMENLCLNKKRLVNITIFLLLFVFFFVIVIQRVSFGCLLQRLSGLPCPACGMTRAFYKIFRLDFIGAFKTNILSIPLSLFLAFMVISLLYDIIFNKVIFVSTSLKLFSKYYIVIIIALIISWIYNIVIYM